MSEEAINIILETAEENGLLDDRYNSREFEKAKKIAKKMLMFGDSPQKIVEITDLPLDVVMSIANQLEEIPAV